MVLDHKQFKTRAIRYARELQIAVRTAEMLSVQHAVAAKPLKQSFDTLSTLLRDFGDVTLGFVNNRVMINKLLTSVTGLAQLENHFLKRGIGAVRFKVGVAVSQYQEAVAILATPVKMIESEGGSKRFLSTHTVDGVKIFPAGKNQKRSEGGDTLLEMDEEAFLLS